MKRIRIIKIGMNESEERIAFICPACDQEHSIPAVIGAPTSGKWGWNGDFESPSISPSISLKIGSFSTPGFDWKMAGFAKDPSVRCHSIINDGKISFCGDCSHSMKNKTVDLPENQFPSKTSTS